MLIGGVYTIIKKNETKQFRILLKAIEIDDKFKEAYYNRGNTYTKINELDKAIDDYTKAIEIDDGYKEAYYNRGCCLWEDE